MLLLGLHLLIACVNAASPSCGQSNTNYYRSHCCPLKIENFYHSTTSPLSTDRCKVVTNQELRKQYPWVSAKDDVEHIIDSNNGPEELLQCNKQIRGNLIIANATWNRQLGRMCWADVANEKRKVYGDRIFNYAYESVEMCCDVTRTNYSSFIMPLLAIFAVGLAIAHIILYKHHSSYQEFVDQSYDTILKLLRLKPRDYNEVELVHHVDDEDSA